MLNSPSRKIAVNILLNTVISIAVFYLLFQLAVRVVSVFHEWETSLQRGIFWEMYLYLFAGVVLVVNTIFLFVRRKTIGIKLLLNATGIMVLVFVFINSFRVAPYSTVLPHFLSVTVLILLPLIISKIPATKRLHNKLTGIEEQKMKPGH